MDKRKKYILLIDVETAGNLKFALPYDISYMVIDKKGNVYEKRAWLVKEIWNNNKLMNTAYYKEKMPLYEEELKNGTYKKTDFVEIVKDIRELVKTYNITTISAYNADFDIKALNNLKKFFGMQQPILPKDRKYNIWCVWAMACQLIYTQKLYRDTAIKQGWVSKTGNIKTNAEVGYRYLTNNYDFEEKHMGIYDIEIEKEILAKCLRQNKKHTKGINKTCWRIPQQIEG